MLLFCLKISKKIIPTAGLGLRFLFALKIDSLTSTNSFIKRFVKNKNSEISHWSFCKLLEVNWNLLNYTGKDEYDDEYDLKKWRKLTEMILNKNKQKLN